MQHPVNIKQPRICLERSKVSVIFSQAKLKEGIMSIGENIFQTFWKYCDHSGIHGFQYLTKNWTSE